MIAPDQAERLYKELKRHTRKTDAFFSKIFGLKNARSLTTSSARLRYITAICNFYELLDGDYPWTKCLKCGYRTTDSEQKTEKNIICAQCGHVIREA